MTYHPAPEQYRAEDHPMGWRGRGHSDPSEPLAYRLHVVAVAPGEPPRRYFCHRQVGARYGGCMTLWPTLQELTDALSHLDRALGKNPASRRDPVTYHPTPEQFRAEDHPMGWRGCGHYDTGTCIALCHTERGPADMRWLAATTHQMICAASPAAAIRAIADAAAVGVRTSSAPAAIARHAATLAAAESLIGYVPRPIARRGKR